MLDNTFKNKVETHNKELIDIKIKPGLRKNCVVAVWNWKIKLVNIQSLLFADDMAYISYTEKNTEKIQNILERIKDNEHGEQYGSN